MGARCFRAVAAAWLLGSLAVGWAQDVVDRDAELQRIRSEVGRLQDELRQLEGRERGLLGRLETLSGERKLREAELQEVTLRLEQLTEAIGSYETSLADLEQVQAERRRYLAFRLREIYKAGPEQTLRRLVRPGGEGYRDGVRYASWLSERDGEMIEAFRRDVARSAQELRELEAARSGVIEARDELQTARDEVARSQRRQQEMLRRLRRDQQSRRAAVRELEAAADALTAVVDTFQPAPAAAVVDLGQVKGLLDWPATGRVSAGFGSLVHPRFKTKVPHPGLDIDAPAGSDIVSVLDGSVVFAEWMRGYGLTAIVDHGGGLHSIYAHASVLMVEAGEQLRGGSLLGKVGDTGSLRGPYLYFELRIDGKPTDPMDWLRRR